MLDYFDDIATDLRVLADVADWRTLSGPEFFTLAVRMPFYSGVLRARMLAEMERDKERTVAAASAVEAEQVLNELERDGWIEKG